MALLTKPDMQQVWASGGDIVEPSDLKKQQGWTVEVPPHQFENWIQNRQDEYLAHINQRGIPQWDGNTEYEASGLSYVQGTDGVVYKSVAASGPATTVQDPTTDITDTYWTVAFEEFGSGLSEAVADTLYLRQDQNGADIDSATTFRTNIGVVAATTTQIGLVELATQAEVEALADSTRAVTANTLVDITCTAWVNFTGTGTVAIRDSYNVSSITDNGVGDYTINFANAMARSDYSLSGMLSFPTVISSSGIGVVMYNEATAPSTSAVRIQTASVNEGAQSVKSDRATISIQIFGGK